MSVVETEKSNGITHLAQLKDAEILIIEDEALMSALMQRYIDSVPRKEFRGRKKGTDLKVLSLESGWELLNADLSHVKVVVMDILLPQVTGVDLIKDFRKRYPNLGIVPVSGMATEPMKRAIHENLPEGFSLIQKPLRKEEFLGELLKAWNFTASNKGGPSASKSWSGPKLEEEPGWTTGVSTSQPVAVTRKKIPRKRAA